ncbi:tRNA synthetases class II family protein, partial [Chlamydia psittaci 84-8471/1]
TY